MRRRLLTPAEVAEMLAVPVKTLYAWRYSAAGPPAVKVGKYVRYDEAELERWLDRCSSDDSHTRRPA